MSTSILHTIKQYPYYYIGAFLIWLFSVSAIIGISIGYKEWFLQKTPLNLLILFAVLILNVYAYAKHTNQVEKTIYVLLFVYIGSLFIEWHGIHFGLLFGPYHYLNNLGYKLDGVPLLIGANWVLLVFSSAGVASRITNNFMVRIILGALLMVFLDFVIEPLAPVFDFWVFDSGLPDSINYISWFVFSLLFHSVYHSQKIVVPFGISLHILLNQFIFFIYFYVYFIL